MRITYYACMNYTKLMLSDFKSKQGTFSKDDYKLRSELIKLQLDKEQLEQEIKDFSTREKAFQEKISMLEEMLVVKDEVVMQLSNKVISFVKNFISNKKQCTDFNHFWFNKVNLSLS